MATKFAQTVLLVVAVACTGWTHAQIPMTTRADLGESFVPSPQVARVMSLGFRALMADYHWLQAVQVAGGADTIDAPIARHLGKLIDVVTTVNPHVGHPYRFAAVWLTHDEDLVRQGNRLLERANKYQPDEWRNHFYLGFNRFFYLGEYEAAAESLEIAMKLPGSPGYLPRLVARLHSHHGDIDVSEMFLRQLLRDAPDEETQARVQSALDEIEIEYKARHLDRARAAFQELTGRDIVSVTELVRPPHQMLERLPSPEPDSIPPSLRRGSTWEIDDKTERIQSTYLGNRYEVHFSPVDRARIEAWDTNREDGQPATHGSEKQGAEQTNG